ncbi:MAG: tetratricopeptide repeat protein, partial [Ignavibacteria bacterium]|nr:tetratricopeptide repeat protein [Ignavibacteria bacterium]
SKNYPNAIKTIDMAFELSKKNGVKYLTQEFYNNLGLIYFYENQVSKAKEIFELALNSSPASESNQNILISIKNNLGDCEFRGQSYSQALKHYFEALSFSENSFLKFISPIIQLKIGKSYEELYLLNKNESDRKNAERYFQFALNRFKENRDLKNLQKALSIVASFYSKINELDKAKKYFFDLDEINLLIELKPEDFLKTFAIKPEYEFDFLNVAVNQNKELAYKIFQNLKFQNVFEYFLKFRDFNFLDGDLSKVFNSLREEILVKNTYEKIYIQEISLPSAQRINEKIKIAKEELSKTNEKVEELISNLASTYQALNTIFEKKTQLDFISNNEQIFVELIPTNENLICFYVSKTGIQVKTIKIDLENLRFNLKTLFQNLNSFTQDELKEFSSTNFGAIADEIISGVINSNSRIRKITFLLNGSDLDFLPHLFYSKKFEQFISEKFSVDYSIFISDDGKISEIKSIGFLKNGKILSNDELISKVNRSDEKSSREKISQRQIRVGLPKKEEIQENKSELNNKNFDFVVTIDNLILNSTSPELNYFDSASRYYFKELLKTKPKFLLLKSVSIDNINLFYLFFSQFYFGKINYIVLPVTKSSQEITDNFLYNYAKRVENKTPLASLNEFFELLKTDKNNIKQNNYWIIYQN